MAGATGSLEAVKRKIQALQQEADEAEERAQVLQRQRDQERELREKVSRRRPGPEPGRLPPSSGRSAFFPLSRLRPQPGAPRSPRVFPPSASSFPSLYPPPSSGSAAQMRLLPV